MGGNEAHPGATVGERQYREVPSGSVLGIQWRVGLLVDPGVEFSTRAGRRDSRPCWRWRWKSRRPSMSIARLYTQTTCSRLVALVARSPRNAVWSTKSSTLLIVLDLCLVACLRGQITQFGRIRLTCNRIRHVIASPAR